LLLIIAGEKSPLLQEFENIFLIASSVLYFTFIQAFRLIQLL
jgi:hypothetical protein